MAYNNQRQQASFKKWLLLYSALFLCVSALIWRPFRLGNKSMIWGYDGLYQTYAAMVYFSQYWREFLANLCAGHLSLPMVDASVGMGFDVLTTLNYYGFGDPLEWLSLFFSRENMELCYNFLVFLRYYLAGLFFGLYCWEMEKPPVASLGGAFAYVFSGFALYAGVRHPYFMNPWLYFPLLCLGVERVLKGKKGCFLSLVAGISACSNFYFFYMLTILTFSYALARLAALGGKRGRAFVAPLLLKGCLWYLLGVALGAVVLVPILFAFMGSARAGGATPFANTWFAYPGNFYKEQLAGYVFPVYSADYWCVLVYPSAAFLGLLALGKKKEDGGLPGLGTWFLMLSLLLWLPLGGLAMNGFGYVSHRWLFGYGFCMALLLVLGLERAETITGKGYLLYSTLFVASACLFFKNGGPLKQGLGFIAVFAVGLFAFLLLKKGFLKKRDRYSWAMVLCVICSALLSSQALYSEEGSNYTAEFQTAKTALSQMTELSEAGVHVPEETGSFFRVEGDTTQVTNWGIVSRINTANSYFSLTKKELYDYAVHMENPDLKFPSWYNGLGDRAPLMSLGCVRFFAKDQGSLLAVPYGYEEKETLQEGQILYESPYAMPIGYTYDALLLNSHWDSLPAIRKQQAAMQAALLDEDGEAWCLENDAFPDSPLPEYAEEPLSYTIAFSNGVVWNQDEGRLLVAPGGGEISLRFKGRPDSETYLRICGFDIEPSGYELLHFYAGLEGTELKKIYCTSSLSSWDGKLKNFLVSVTGKQEELGGWQNATLSFPFGGEFALDALEMYSLPMEPFARQALDRKEESLDADLVQNQIKGRIQVSGNRILCIGVPYSKGWRAEVNGEPVPLWKCNDLYLGLFLKEGSHQVVLSYQTPGLVPGAAISLCALLLLVGTWFMRNRSTCA